jgi:hypothetical protein
MNTTLSKFAIDDNQDGKMLWIELEKGLEYMIGVIPIYSSWLPAKLKETDTLYIKHMEIDPSVNVDVKITFLNPNTNKEIHSKTILSKKFNTRERKKANYRARTPLDLTSSSRPMTLQKPRH